MTEFVVGKYSRFDALAAKCVKAAKKRHSGVTPTLLLLYPLYDHPTPTPADFDGTFYPLGMETVPKRAAIVRANRYMVAHSEYLIAYVQHSASKAWDLAKYVRRYEKQGSITITALLKP